MDEGRIPGAGFSPAGTVSAAASRLPVRPYVSEPSVEVSSASGRLMPVEEESDEKELEEEAEEAVRKAEVRTPTKEEVRKHNVSHLPFRNWCPQCVAGRGKDERHPEREEPEGGRGAEVHFDYAFLRNEVGSEKATVLVGRCRQS